MTTDLTPYDDVNAIVCALASRSRETLGGELLALYLHGSLATGAFDPQRSDIDFIAIVAHPLSDATIEALRAMHRALLREGAPWSLRLEGSFVHAALLRSAAPPPEPGPLDPSASGGPSPRRHLLTPKSLDRSPNVG